MNRHKTSMLTVALVVLLVIAIFVPVPYVIEGPGPLFNTLGASHGRQYVNISGVKTYATSGELNMTTVSVFGGPGEGVDLFQAIGAVLSSRYHVLPREALYPENLTQSQNAAINAEAFSTSQSFAIGAAMKYLHQHVNEQIVVSSIQDGMPAQGKLSAGDVIVAIDGVKAVTPQQTVNLVHVPPVGRVATFTVLRNSVSRDIKIKTVPKPGSPKVPYVGIGVDTLYSADFPITFGVNDVGGPSAGTMFALAIIDKLTPGGLANGKVIAGTGTIDPDGAVGPIGGIAQKMIGARDHGAVLFLAPIENCDEVIGHIPDGLTVTPIHTLSGAVQTLRDYRAGKMLKHCEVKNSK